MKSSALIIANWTSNPKLPEPIGVIYSIDKPTYNQDMVDQINFAKEKKGSGSAHTRGQPRESAPEVRG